MLPLNGRRILITGAGGFLGRNLVTTLVGRGALVNGLIGPPGFLYPVLPRIAASAYGWIEDPGSLSSLTKSVDTIVHLAGPASVAASFQSPADYFRAHLIGTAVTAEACRSAGIKRLVYVTTAEVYGQPERNPVAEDGPLQPQSPYAAAKAGAEMLLRSYGSAFGLQLVILRPFSIYGPGCRPESLVAKILRQVLERQPIVLHDLRPVRDYCYVADVVEAIVLSCTVQLSAPLNVYNIGSQTGLSVAELARTAAEIAHADLPICTSQEADRPRHVDIVALISDSRRAAEDLGWRSHTSLKCGLQRTLQYLRERQ